MQNNSMNAKPKLQTKPQPKFDNEFQRSGYEALSRRYPALAEMVARGAMDLTRALMKAGWHMATGTNPESFTGSTSTRT